jgi:hypothetical protein
MMVDMTKPYARCRYCGVPKSQVRISKRGMCAECAIARATTAVIAMTETMAQMETVLASRDEAGDKDAP